MSKKDVDAPDYTPLTDLGNKSADRMDTIGQGVIDFAQKEYDRNAPRLDKIGDAQKGLMTDQAAQGKDYFDYYKDTFRPLEKSIVSDAQNFDTDAYRNRLATQAAADSGLAFNRTTKANERAMASMGVNPNSGRFQGIGGQNALMQSANRAGNMTRTRERAVDAGFNRKVQAAGLGNYLSGASTSAYGNSVNAGANAADTYQSAGRNYTQGANLGGALVGQGLNMNLNTLGEVMNQKTKIAMQESENRGSLAGDFGALAGGATKMYSSGMFGNKGSDERLKDNIKKVGKDERTGLNLYEFNYKWNNAHKFIGVMAHEVIKKFPEAVSNLGGMFDGYMGVNYQMLGLEMKEVH
jgi:hypothetical protein